MDEYNSYAEVLNNLTEGRIDSRFIPLSFAAARGEPIQNLYIHNETLYAHFPSGMLTVRDSGQSCCENRYMSTDDELHTFIGARLVNFEEVPGPQVDDEYGDVHEQMFVKLETTAGTITLVTHNEHNGYYGGFHVEADWHSK